MESKMDFHSLSRKVLQALCKRNKIPANLTNVAMADSLQALDNVEGLDEITCALTSDSLQSPKRTVPASPDIPRTAGRTSTRRRNANIDPESSQPLTRTRRTTRRAVAEETSQENINVNLPETPAISTTRRRKPAASACPKVGNQLMEEAGEEKHVEQENNDAPETPAMQSCRRRAPITSTRKKMEAQRDQNSVQRVYGTRQSVRLLEKNMAKLGLMEKVRVELGTLDGLSNEMEDFQEKPDVPGADSLMLSTESLEKSNDMKVLSFENLDQYLNKESETTHEFKEEDKKSNDSEVDDKKSNDSEVDDCHMNADTGSEKCDNLDDVSRSQAKDDVNIEISIKSDFEVGHLENAEDVNHQALHKNGENEALNSDRESVERNLNGIQDFLVTEASNDSSVCVIESEHGYAGNVPEEDSAKAVEEIIASEVFPPDETVSKVNKVEPIITDSLTTKDSEFLDKSSNINLTEDEQLCDCDFQTESAIHDKCDEIISVEVHQNDNEVIVQNDFLLPRENFHLEQSERRDEPESPKTVPEIVSTEVREHDYNITVQNNDQILPEKSHLEQSESINETESPKTVPKHETDSDYDIIVHNNDPLLPKKLQLEQSESINETESPKKLQLEQSESINETESPKNVTEHETDSDYDIIVQNNDQILPVKLHLEQSESKNETESPKTVTEHETDSDYDIIVQNNDPLLLEKLHLEQSKSINETESPKTVSEPEISKEVLDNLVSQSCVRNILPDQSPNNVMESSKMQELSEVLHDPLGSSPVSGGKFTGEIALLPFAADTLQGQFPRPTETTPRKPSTVSLPTTQRMTHASEINKENINGGWKIETEQEKLKKNVIGQEAALGDMSLRMLTKMLKDKLQIASKKNEENNTTKGVEETRMALRTLPDNCMLSATVPENQN